jgi:hypothetical protein
MKILEDKKIIVGATALALGLGTFASHADDDTGWNAAIGISRLDANFKDTDDGSFDDSDNTVQLKGGYMFNDVFGLELGWMDLGDYQGDGRIKIDADGFWLVGVLNWSVANQIDLYGKAGAYFIKAKSDQVIPGFGAIREDQDNTEFGGALGAEWDFGKPNLFFEYARVDTEVSDLTIDTITLGFKYEF